MSKFFALAACVACFFARPNQSRADGQIFVVEHPSSMGEGKLHVGVTYTLWIPEGVKTLRGVIVHQHGAGVIAANSGMTAAYDLHWQALARKWDCALLGPSYHVLNEDTDTSPGGSEWWFDPRRGSDQAFLTGLQELANKSNHPELTSVPWALWGHSSGGTWADMMTSLHPTRVIAVWLRSGSQAVFRGHISLAPLPVPEAVYEIPFMCNVGAKEKGDSKYNKVWDGVLTTFSEYRAKGGLIGFAPDPRTRHETGDSRYLAIPFLDACLAARLPAVGSETMTLRAMPTETVYLAPLFGTKSFPKDSYPYDPAHAVWLPNKSVAAAWDEYVQKGAVSDLTPPPAPFNVAAIRTDMGNQVTWDAYADLESGIGNFIILRDGKPIGKVPAKKPKKVWGRPLFQVMSFHDTPMTPLPAMIYIDKSTKPGSGHEYSVETVNSVGLASTPSTEASIPEVTASR